MSDTPRRRINWHKIHSFFGLSVSLYLAFIFLTGTLLVFAPEIDKAIDKTRQVEPLPEGKMSWGEIYDVVQAERPGWRIVRMLRSESATSTDEIAVEYPDKPGSVLLSIDPYRGEFLGELPVKGFRSIIVVLHQELFIKGRKGVLLVTAFSLPLTAAVIAGLLTYRRFWTGFFRWPRRTGSTRAFLSDLHRLIAVWSAAFLLVVSLTSLWFFTNTIIRVGGGAKIQTEQRETLLPDGFDGKALDTAMRLAAEAMPDQQVLEVRLPWSKTDAIVMMGPASAILTTERENTVHVHPETLELVGIQRGEDLSLPRRLMASAIPLHHGTWGGTTSRVLWLLFGMAATALAVIGIMINVKRLGAMEAKRPTGPARSAFARTWRAMGPYGLGAWISSALILWGLTILLYRVFLT